MRVNIKLALESIVVGIMAQAIVGWVSPFTPILTGFLAGVVIKNERDGTVTGFAIGALTAIGFVVRRYMNLNLPYLYPTSTFLGNFGDLGTYAIVLVMIFAGIIGGKVGGSLMQRSVTNGYQRGAIVGELKKIRKEEGKRKKFHKSS